MFSILLFGWDPGQMDQLQKWELAHPEGSQEEIIEWFNKEHAKRFKANN